MDLEFTDDQLGLRDAARSVLADACPPSLVRAVFEGTGTADDLWVTLRGLDWPALGIATEHGGLGEGFLEVGIVVEELGRVVAPGPFLATVTQFAAAVAACGSSFRLADVALGQCTGSLAIAEDGRWDPALIRCAAVADGDGWRLTGTKTHVVDGATATVSGRVGSLEAPVEVTDAVRPGVVSLPHGWGHDRDGGRNQCHDSSAPCSGRVPRRWPRCSSGPGSSRPRRTPTGSRRSRPRVTRTRLPAIRKPDRC